MSSPNKASRAGVTNPFLWPPQFETYYTIGHRADKRVAHFATLDQIAAEFGVTRQTAYTLCLVALGKCLYNLVREVQEVPDL